MGCGSGRDVIPETHDVRGVADDPARPEARDKGGYEYVAKRALSVVGLAEARGMDREGTVRIVETLADSLEAYFASSEQLPTRLILAADDERGAGFLVQKVPGAASANESASRAQSFETIPF